jgi:transposase
MTPLLTDTLWSTVEPLLPTHKPSPKGGHPRCNDRQCLEGILYVLRGGIAWHLLPGDFGVSSSTCWRRFNEWTTADIWDKVHRKLLSELGKQGDLDINRVVIDSASVRAVKGGAHTGPSPVDRSKPGCKRHVICDTDGIPLVIAVGPANQRDEELVVPMLKQFPTIPDEHGKKHKKPKAIQGDRGYGFVHIIKLVVRMAIISLLALRGSPHGSGLGKTRYVVERTLAWLSNYRRLKVCYERTGERFRAFHVLAACVICSDRLAENRPKRL